MPDSENVAEHLRNLLLRGEVGRASEVLKAAPKEKVYEILQSVAEEGEESAGIASYGAVALLCAGPSDVSFWNGVAGWLLAVSLCWIPGAYSLGLFHAMRAAEEAPGERSYLELVLVFASGPDSPMTREEKEAAAKRVLQFDPSSEAALEMIERLNSGD